MNTNPDDYDVVVIGGSFCGSSMALLLKRWRPQTRILVIEQAAQFDRKVGEATVELSGLFLVHVLRLHDLLSRDHLHKMGLRFWFTDGEQRSLEEMSEVGSTLVPSLPSFQLDRALLDEALSDLCAQEGTQVERPAKVTAVDLGSPTSRVCIQSASGERTVTARWVIDASGKRCYLGKQLGLIERFDEHKTAAAWGHFKGVKDMDGIEVLGSDARRPAPLSGIPVSRRLCTNHFMGLGWWCWVIPHADGDTSIGLVHDRNLFSLPGDGSKHERFESFLRNQNGLKDLLKDAEFDSSDFKSYEHLAYRSSQYMGPGWALVGDAAGFLDPYYSPGLDHCATSIFATASLLEKDMNGEFDSASREAAIEEHNDAFTRSYPLYFEALYKNKYEIFGDAELTAIAFYLDTAMYYQGVLHGPFKDINELSQPPFGRNIKAANAAWRLMSFTNRRLVQIARNRQARGTYGRLNTNWISVTRNFGSSNRTITAAHWKGLRMWARVELIELWEKAFGATRPR